MILPIEHVRVRPVLRRRSYRCRKPFRRVFQFRISLKDITPTIWRSIQVPDCDSFWNLHCAITDSLGWLDSHLHLFTLRNPRTGKTEQIGSPDDEGFETDYEKFVGWKKQMGDYFTEDNRTAVYEYDFGDSWEHSITLEAILRKEAGVAYPRCIAGERACPPEDCGGVTGFENFLKAITDPDHKEHDDLLTWVGGWFDPEWFDRGLVRFENPDARWRIAYRDMPVPKTMRQAQYHHFKQ